MSYDELINAIERDAHKERQRIKEAAEAEAKNIIADAEKELRKIKDDKLAELRHSFEEEKIRAVSNARKDAKALALSAKAEIISEVFKEAENKIFELQKKKEYSAILIRLFNEAAEKWKEEFGADEFEACVSENILNNDLDGIRVKSDKDIKGGVVLVSMDKRLRFVNTLESRIERIKADVLPILNRILFA